MASSLNAALCALVATALWGFVGFTIARHLLPRVLALGAAPIIGWEVYNAIALPLFMLVGFSATTVIGLAVVAVLLATGSLLAGGPMRDPKSEIAIPAWAYVAAAALALAPACAVAPKFVGDTVQLATPIFDHSKAAMIDAMTRRA